MQSWALPSLQDQQKSGLLSRFVFSRPLGMNLLGLAETIWLPGSFLTGTGFQSQHNIPDPPEIAEAQDCILGYSQPSLRDCSWILCLPRIASWATFSRPYGTEFSW